MRAALISDIHGNLEALTAVFEDIEKQKVDKIHCLGDVLGYGCDPVACVHLVEKNCDIKLLGNHEYAVLGLVSTANYNAAAQTSTDWTRSELTDVELSLIADFQMTQTMQNSLLVHASPNEPDRWHYILSDDTGLEAFAHFKEKFCFHGHSHVPRIFIERPGSLPRIQAGHSFLPGDENRYLINVGSVGQPRDNDPRACYVIYDTENHEIEYRRVDYDIAATQQKMTQARLPEMLISRLSLGR